MSQIKSVVFDVGWVLVHLDYNPLLDYLGSSGQSYVMIEVIAGIDLEGHERGEFGGEQLVDNMLRLAPDLDRGQLESLWTSMFKPVEPMFALARRLSETHSVHLLSNVGDLHWT